jgi:hypothetical protein
MVKFGVLHKLLRSWLSLMKFGERTKVVLGKGALRSTFWFEAA